MKPNTNMPVTLLPRPTHSRLRLTASPLRGLEEHEFQAGRLGKKMQTPPSIG